MEILTALSSVEALKVGLRAPGTGDTEWTVGCRRGEPRPELCATDLFAGDMDRRGGLGFNVFWGMS